MGNNEDFVDLVAERALMSIVLSNKDKFIESTGLIGKNDFSNEANKLIFSALERAFDVDPDNIDKFSIASHAADLGFKNYDELTLNGKYTESLFIQKVNPKNLEKLLGRVKDLSIKRRLRVGVRELGQSIEDSEEDNKTSVQLISEFETKVAEYVAEGAAQTEISILGEGLMDLVNERADTPVQNVGIPTGFARFDKAIGGGLRRGAVHFIGARPKNFKSGLALNIAKNLAINNIYGKPVPVLYLDTELTNEYQKFRLAASVAKVPIDLIEQGTWRSNPQMVNSIEAALTKVDSAPFYHSYVGGFGMDRILNVARYWLTKYVGRDSSGKYNDCVVIYDYLKLMDTKELKNDMKEWQVLGFHTTALHNFVVRNNIPLLCFGQLNRDGSDCDEETVVAGADRILWFSSSFSILRHKKLEELEKDGPAAGNMRIVTVMTRYGPGMDKGDYLCLRSNRACMLIEEHKYRTELSTYQDVGKKEAEESDENDDLNSPYD